MKRILSSLLAAGLCLSLMACGQNNNSNATTTASEKTVQTTAAETTKEEATEAETTKEEATEAETTKEEATEAETTKEEATEAETTKEEATEAETTKEEATDAETTKEEATEAETTKEEATEAETTKEEAAAPDYAAMTKESDSIVKIIYKTENNVKTLRVLQNLKGDMQVAEFEDFAKLMQENRAYILFTKTVDGKQAFTGSEEDSLVILDGNGDQHAMFEQINKVLHGNKN